MIDFTNKAITTKSDLESEQLLKKAVAQGFGLPKGEKALIANRFFRTISGNPRQFNYRDESVELCISAH